jgi:hypothetical protein
MPPYYVNPPVLILVFHATPQMFAASQFPACLAPSFLTAPFFLVATVGGKSKLREANGSLPVVSLTLMTTESIIALFIAV